MRALSLGHFINFINQSSYALYLYVFVFVFVFVLFFFFFVKRFLFFFVRCVLCARCAIYDDIDKRSVILQNYLNCIVGDFLLILIFIYSYLECFFKDDVNWDAPNHYGGIIYIYI